MNERQVIPNLRGSRRGRTSRIPVCIERLVRVLLLNLGVDSLRAANSSLASQGYDVATYRGLAVDQVLSPDVLVTEVTPSDLSCCGLIAQLKARPETESSLKIVMVVQGGAVERACTLDLGADDVISFPFEPVEFAARIRAQFRERKPHAAGILAILVFRPSIYPWYGRLEITTEGWPSFKQAWLSYPFFLTRTVIYLTAWLVFSWAIRRNSRRQDGEGGITLGRKNTRLSVMFIVVFGVTFWLASTDWVMSLEPNWASTIFGIYHFAGMFLSGVATITLLALASRAAGPLRHGVSDQQFLDLGRLLVAFSTFWMYIWFSQYMLIWYVNLSEETSYIALRPSSGWGRWFVLNVLLNWALPFLLLLPRANKMNPRTLATASAIILLGRITDLYLMVIPPFSPARAWPAFWDLVTLAASISGLLFIALRNFFSSEPLPGGSTVSA